MIRRAVTISILIASSAIALPACSQETGNDAAQPVAPSKKRQTVGDQGPASDIKSLKREEVQAGVKRSLLQGKRPLRAKDVRCPLDIPAIKGQKVKCKATIKGRRVSVGVKITAVSARNIRYSIRTPPLPR